MKIKRNTMFGDSLKHIDTIHIPRNELKPSVLQGIKIEGLYFLERIFGECDGHGCGMGSEDISFTLEAKTKLNPHKHAIVFEMTDNGRKLEISERLLLFGHKNLGGNGKKIRWHEAHEIENVPVSPELVRIIKKYLVRSV